MQNSTNGRSAGIVAIISVVALSGCANFGVGGGANEEDVERVQLWLESRAEALIADPSVPGFAVSVRTPDASYDVASGWADGANGIEMTSATPVRIASNTKTFVAAATLRLVEQGELDLGASIGSLLPADWVEALDGDGYWTNAMTLRHLLTHTSGLAEHTRPAGFFDRIAQDSGHEWTPREQVWFALSEADPVGSPGEVFYYSDTGYVIIGQILERLQHRPLATVVREQLGFDAAGFSSTWWELFENAPEGAAARAHQWSGDLDTFDWHPSMDLFGGGGLLSSTADLADFYDQLFEGRVFEQHGTLSQMLSPAGLPSDSPYRMGMFTDTVGGEVAWQHSGFWGTFAVRIPSLETTIAFAVTQKTAFPAVRVFVDELVLYLAANG